MSSSTPVMVTSTGWFHFEGMKITLVGFTVTTLVSSTSSVTVTFPVGLLRGQMGFTIWWPFSMTEREWLALRVEGMSL